MSKVEKLREEIDDTLEDTANSLSPSRHKDFIGLDDVLDSLIAAAKEEERERIRNANGVLRLENDDAHAVWVTAGEYFILPASLLSPAPKEANNDKS